MVQLDEPNLSSRREYYTPRGIRVPGVTDVLKVLDDRTWVAKFILKHGNRKYETVRNTGVALGTEIHAVAEQIAYNPTFIPRQDHLLPYASALKEFHHQYVKRVIAAEFGLASDTERCGGTCDLYCELHTGELAVVDFKSKKSGGVTAKDRLQTCGYSLLLRDVGRQVNRRMVVLIRTEEGKEGSWYMRFADDHVGDVRAFRAAVEIYHWRPRTKYKYPRSTR